MKLFLIIGSFIFLILFVPYAMQDGKVTLYELVMIGVNFLSIGFNLWNLVEEK